MSIIYRADKIVKERLEPAVVLEQAKKQLNVDIDYVDDDNHILMLVESATGAAEDYIARDIALTHNLLKVYEYNGSSITIKESPFLSIDKITTVVDGVSTELPDDSYKVYTAYNKFTIEFTENVVADELIVEFLTGYDGGTAPAQLTNAILVKVASLYDVERSNYSFGVAFKDNKAFENLLSGYVNTIW